MRASNLLSAGLLKSALASGLFSNSFGVPGQNASFDYVVVGGGTAGLTIAARLAEDQDVTVAVVEGGGFYQTDNGNGRLVNQEDDHLTKELSRLTFQSASFRD